MVSLNSFSQDLIARQAPTDRKLKSVDSLALQKQIRWNSLCIRGWICIRAEVSMNLCRLMAMLSCRKVILFDLKGFNAYRTYPYHFDVFGYRPRRRRAHYGLDIKVYVGDTIRAAFDGKVRYR